MTALLAEPVRAVVLPALRGRIGGGTQCWQGAHLWALEKQRPEHGSDGPDKSRQVASQLGVGAARVSGDGDGGFARFAQPALQLVGEQQISQFGLSVGGDAVVTAFPLQVVEVDGSVNPVALAADGHHPRTGYRQHVVEYQSG